MRTKIAAGNWKMNKNYQEGLNLVLDIQKNTQPSDVLVILATPFLQLKEAIHITRYNPHIKIAAQNCHHEEKGAYTGEVSANMLAAINVEYVIIGHSERRQYNRESNEIIAQKVNAALKAGLKPIFCCGESLEIRNEGWQERFVNNQIERGLLHLSAEELESVIIAYEPIWAIGTGLTASPEQAQDMHFSIRKKISEEKGEKLAQNMSILYGGSVKPNNATQLFSQKDVDGGLVGGASLKASTFIPIIQALENDPT